MNNSKNALIPNANFLKKKRMTKREKEIIDKFYKETWCELSVKEGKFYYDGNLDLVGNKYISQLPDNLTVNGFLDLTDSSIIE